jgi:hypothetical protein
MPLDQTARGVLEQIIDGIIRNIPDFVKILYNPSQKAQLHIENERDFLLGISLGYYITHFRATLSLHTGEFLLSKKN